MRLFRHRDEPKRETKSFDELWNGSDHGLIACWERGREKAKESPELAAAATANELPILPWSGGVEKKIKSKTKHGSFSYLAMWQGLRGVDLDIDTDVELTLVCSRFEVPVTFTSDTSKFNDGAEA